MKRGLLLLVVAVLLVAVPAALLVWMRTQTEDRLAGLDPDPVPVILQVEQRDVVDVMAVSVVGSWGEPDSVTAPAWIGTITSVSLAPGDRVTSGDVVASIDAIDRVAIASSSPFWRSLRRRDTGDDVAMLEAWLLEAGFYDGNIDGVFDLDLETALKAWSTQIGVTKPDGSFDPGWAVWLPSDPFEVGEVLLKPGSPAPGPGSRILGGPTLLESVSLLDNDGSTFEQEGVWVLRIGTVELLIVDGSIGEEGLLALNDELGVDQPSAGRITRAEPTAALVIPATAVVSNASGALCVFVPSGAGFSAAPIQLSGGSVAKVYVESGLESGDNVLVNPSDIIEPLICP